MLALACKWRERPWPRTGTCMPHQGKQPGVYTYGRPAPSLPPQGLRLSALPLPVGPTLSARTYGLVQVVGKAVTLQHVFEEIAAHKLSSLVPPMPCKQYGSTGAW